MAVKGKAQIFNPICIRHQNFLNFAPPNAEIYSAYKRMRGVAQLASVLAWGASGRQFESDHSD